MLPYLLYMANLVCTVVITRCIVFKLSEQCYHWNLALLYMQRLPLFCLINVKIIVSRSRVVRIVDFKYYS